MGAPVQFLLLVDNPEPQPCPQAQTPALEPRSGLEPVRTRKEGELVGEARLSQHVPIDCVTGWGSSGKKLRVCLCTRVWTHGCTCICACTHVHVCVPIWAHTCMNVCVQVCMCAPVCKHVHMCTRVCICVCAHVHKCLYSMCTCVHVCVWAVSGRGRESRG